MSSSPSAGVDDSADDLLEMRALRESAMSQPYIELIDNLRELGIERDLEGGIPQIAVMGDQSSGKSSVLLFPSSRGGHETLSRGL